MWKNSGNFVLINNKKLFSMNRMNLKRKHRNDEFDNIDLFEESMEGKEFEEPEK